MRAMTIEQQIREAVVVAQKARAKEELTVLRMAISDLKYAAIEKKGELDNAAVISLLRKQVKQRHEAASLYRKGGSEKRAAAEEREIEILERFLPRQLDEKELAEILTDLVASHPGVPTPQLMKDAMALVAGRADGRQVKAALEALQADS